MIKFVAVLVGLGLIYANKSDENIQYFQTPTISLKDTSDNKIGLINDSVYLVKTSSDLPLYYYTMLSTGVCFDNKCRSLSLNIYWNITGRYLGFELPDEEFLSKYDHEPFKADEYALLDSLLANPFLPLGNYSFYDLVDVSSDGNPDVDGVSGATSQDVKDYIVPEAAYTTYKLWNVVYGPVQDEVMISTQNQLDGTLFKIILQSPVPEDQMWAAERTGLLGDLNNELIELIINYIKEGDYTESYLMLKSITTEQLYAGDLQIRLFKLIGNVDYAVEKLIFEKLKEIEALNPAILEISTSSLHSYSDMQLVNVLKLLKHHQAQDPKIVSELEGLVAAKNPYIKSQIEKFLEVTP